MPPPQAPPDHAAVRAERTGWRTGPYRPVRDDPGELVHEQYRHERGSLILSFVSRRGDQAARPQVALAIVVVAVMGAGLGYSLSMYLFRGWVPHCNGEPGGLFLTVGCTDRPVWLDPFLTLVGAAGALLLALTYGLGRRRHQRARTPGLRTQGQQERRGPRA
jgi:hypothetical protein